MIAKEEIEEALNQAIASHEDRARGGYGLSDCPLCMLSDKNCKEYCPITKLTSQSFCDGTPFYRIENQRETISYNDCTCPTNCSHRSQCDNGEIEFCILEEENEVAFLKWIRYNLKMGWI
jgi:hypothetical protein